MSVVFLKILGIKLQEAFWITNLPESAPDEAELCHVTFKEGKPVALNGKEMKLADLIQEMNVIGR